MRGPRWRTLGKSDFLMDARLIHGTGIPIKKVIEGAMPADIVLDLWYPPLSRYEAKRRIMALTWLLDTIQSHATRHLDANNFERVKVLDARFNAVEDELIRVSKAMHHG